VPIEDDFVDGQPRLDAEFGLLLCVGFCRSIVDG